jgi:hypothetical protein
MKTFRVTLTEDNAENFPEYGMMEVYDSSVEPETPKIYVAPTASTNTTALAAKAGIELTPEILDYTETIVRECVKLIDYHSEQLRRFNFETNAKTSDSCAGMILEHFGLTRNS